MNDTEKHKMKNQFQVAATKIIDVNRGQEMLKFEYKIYTNYMLLFYNRAL